MAGYRRAGANLAATVLSMMRRTSLRDRAARSPYPQLQTLLAAVDGTELIVGSRGCRFRDLVAGREFRLAGVLSEITRGSQIPARAAFPQDAMRSIGDNGSFAVVAVTRKWKPQPSRRGIAS